MGVWQRFFKRQDDVREIETLKLSLRDSFSRVAGDVSQLKTWVLHLHQLHSDLNEAHHVREGFTAREVQTLTEKISTLERDQKQLANYLSNLIDYLQKRSQFEAEFASRLNKFESELKSVSQRREIKSELEGSSSSVRTSFEPKSELRSDMTALMTNSESEPRDQSRKTADSRSAKGATAFEERMLQRFRIHRKDYVVQKMIEAIEAEGLTTNELEELIVERKGLCGRTSYFSYLKELKIKSIFEDVLVGKRKILAVRQKISKKTDS